MTTVFVGVVAVIVTVVFALPEYTVHVTGGGVLKGISDSFGAQQAELTL
jgi:hypothetical protein